MAQLGGGKINPRPCTPDDNVSNWTVQNQLNQHFTNLVGADTYKVKVSTNDGAANFLSDSLENINEAYEAGEDFPIAWEIPESLDPDEFLRLYVNSSGVAGYNTSGTYAACLVDGVLQWYDTTAFGGSGSDDKTVKISSNDDTAGYLHTKTKDHQTYTETSDLLIHTVITDALADVPPGDGNEHVRWFIDASLITGNSASGLIMLGKVDDEWNFVTSTDVIDDLTLVRLTFGGGTLTAPKQSQMLRGQCTANVLAGAATFSIDHIELLSDCLDPRSVPGSTTETLIIHKEDVKTGFRNDEWIVAVRNDTDSQWELLATERYRSIRGTWVSGTASLTIDNINVLENGLDPRTDTTSTSETVSVSNPSNSLFTTGDTVHADWNARTGLWEARPKSSPSTGTFGRVTVEITAATDNLVENWGEGEIRTMDVATGELAVGSSVVRNPWNVILPVDAMVKVVGDIVDNGTCTEYPWAAE